MNAYLKIHQQKYPKRTLQDDIKFLYQHHLGCEHFVFSPQKTFEYILSEPKKQKEMEIEDIGNGFVRVHFGILQNAQATLLNRIFVKTSEIKGDKQAFLKDLLDLKNDSNKEEIDAYIASGMPSIHHSEVFRNAYEPCYRVCDKKMMQYFDVLLKAQELKEGIIGIDGRCGSGKSTLGQLIADLFNLQLVHMDHFYLPLDMRTKERLSTPGGNVYYERVLKEVIMPYQNKQDTTFGLFDCSIMDLNEKQTLHYEPKIVIEGSYAFVPALRDYYDLKIFSTISKEAQKKRIIGRNGLDGWPMFENRWIPLEELYFSNNDLEKIADIVVDTSNF